MAKKMEMFFDYACPYCLKGHDLLVGLIAEYPEIEMIWCPCEAHPRAEEDRSRYSDICIQGMFFAQENHVDMWAFHEAMYQAAVTDKADIEDIDVLASYVKDLLDVTAFKEALHNKVYEQRQLNANPYAYEKNDIWAVPSFRMSGKALDAAEGIGVTEQQLKAFMDLSKIKD